MNANRSRGLVLGVLAALTACGAPGAGLDTSAPASAPTRSAGSQASPGSQPSQPSPVPSGAAVNRSGAAEPWASVNAGRFAGDPAARTLVAYASARVQAAITYDAALPAFVAVVTPRWQAFQAGEFAKMRDGHLTIPRPTRWAIVGISRSGGAARVGACVWGPSGGLRDVRTGRWAEPVETRWYAQDLRMLLAGGRWRVDAAYDGTFSCEEAR